MKALILTGLAVLTVTLPLTAQGSGPALEPGVRVRATTRTGERVEGKFGSWREGRLTIATQGREASIPRENLRRLEVGRVGRATGTGALIGGIAGALAATAFAIPFCGDADTVCETDEYVRIYGLIGLPPIAAGALIGSAIERTHWDAVPLDRLAVGVGPAPGGGVTVALRLRF
ncbi:MAG: hypothetical protein AB7L66_10645 [Gemmatimonadales bacterium]